MNEGKLIKSWDAHAGGVAAVAICNDGTMASTGRDSKVKVWDGVGTAAGEMPALVETGHEVAITVDSKQIIAGDWSGNVRMWQRANPKDERSLAANPIPLEQSLAAVKLQLRQATVVAQSAQAEFDTLQSKQLSAQRRIADLQSQIASATTELKSVSEQMVQLKSQSDSIVSQLATKTAELVKVQALKTEKSSQRIAAVAAKKTADDTIVVLQTQRTAQGADATSIDAQIAIQAVLSQAQEAAIAKFQTELQAIDSDFTAREKLNSELKAAFDTKNSEFVAAATKVQEVTSTKTGLEQGVEPASIALKATDEALAAARSKCESANSSVSALQLQADSIQADIAKFIEFPMELSAKRNAIEQAMAVTSAQVEPAETQIATTKTRLESASGDVAKLEQQLAVLQSTISAEQAKRAKLQSEMSEKKKAVETIRGQIQQSEAELANATLQQQLFEKAFGNK